jgi:hypothetical protein
MNMSNLMSNLYPQDEQDRINKIKESNEKLEAFFQDKREDWNKKTEPLYKTLSVDLTNPSNLKAVINIQSDALSYRQVINEQINFFLNKRSKEMIKIKRIKQEKFIFYATGFGVKTNLGEKSILIDAHLAENERNIEMLDSYIDFLRDTSKTIESLQYSIKNMIELINYLGGR